MNDDIYVDANGRLAERIQFGASEMIVHYDDIPDSDITIVSGVRCTTPLRTLIDLAPEVDAGQLDRLVRECLQRRMFTVAQALARIAEPDMQNLPGARLLRKALPATG